MPWYDGFSAEDVGHIQNRGLDKLEGDALAQSLYKSFRGAESKLGLPADRVLRLPDKPDDAAGWATIHKALGRPDKPEEYNIADVKFSDGEEFTPEFSAWMKNIAHKLNLPAGSAAVLAKEMVTELERQMALDATEAANSTAKDAGEKARVAAETKASNVAQLNAKWPGQYDANYRAAQGVAMQLGYTAEELTEMAASPKFVPFMERMLVLHKAGGEAPAYGNGGGNGGPAMRSEEQLLARRAEIMSSSQGKMLSGEQFEKAMKELAEISGQLVAMRHARR